MTQHSMTELMADIEARRLRLSEHPFLAAIDASSDVEDLRGFLPHLYFYVFAFQDMLRLAHEEIHDTALREIAGGHRAEDAGHEAWFAEDAAVLGCVRDVPWVFGPQHRPTRDMSYAIIGEILHAGDDRVRLAVPLVLEAVGSVFFYRVVGLLERAGDTRPLRYFARSHQQVESDHDIFTEQGQRMIASIRFDAAAFARASEVVARCFAQFDGLATHLGQQLAAARAGR